MIKIEKGVAFPTGYNTKKYKYPFSDMGVGDSFSVPSSDAQKVRSAAGQHARRKGGTFSIRAMGDHARCWRIE